jgi:phospholipid N-methyltransferase
VGVSAVAPSSQKLARAMVNGLDLKPNEGLIEIGPGTGALTRQIREVIPESNDYLGIELEGKFVALLKQDFPELQFVHNSMVESHEIHEESGKAPVKIIISGLSVSTLPRDIQDQFIENLDRILEPGCMFRMFQYIHAYPLPSSIRFRHRMAEHFSHYHRSRLVMKNLPPAYVVTWTR